MTAALKPWDFTAVLVDDEESVLRAMFRDLRDEGFGVVAFSDAGAALDALQALHRRGELPLDRADRHTYDLGPPPDAVDVLIADVRMPGLTGIDLLTRANDLFPDALRFVLTGYADIKDAVDAINRARARYYFTKPWTYAEIRRLLFHYLEAYRIESDRRRLKRVAAEGLAQVARDLVRLENDLQEDLGHVGLTEDMKTQILGLDLQKRVLQHLQFLHQEHFPAVQRVLRLVAYLERLERAALTLRYERTFLPALVREAYDRLSDAYRAKPVTIHLDLNLPRADVLADEPILADAAEFLLGFALEAVAPGELVAVRFAREAEEIEAIADKVGFPRPEEMLALVIEGPLPDPDSLDLALGSLGWKLVRHAVELHQGRLGLLQDDTNFYYVAALPGPV